MSFLGGGIFLSVVFFQHSLFVLTLWSTFTPACISFHIWHNFSRTYRKSSKLKEWTLTSCTLLGVFLILQLLYFSMFDLNKNITELACMWTTVEILCSAQPNCKSMQKVIWCECLCLHLCIFVVFFCYIHTSTEDWRFGLSNGTSLYMANCKFLQKRTLVTLFLYIFVILYISLHFI